MMVSIKVFATLLLSLDKLAHMARYAPDTIDYTFLGLSFNLGAYSDLLGDLHISLTIKDRWTQVPVIDIRLILTCLIPQGVV